MIMNTFVISVGNGKRKPILPDWIDSLEVKAVLECFVFRCSSGRLIPQVYIGRMQRTGKRDRPFKRKGSDQEDKELTGCSHAFPIKVWSFFSRIGW
jgi:hypothetical protein